MKNYLDNLNKEQLEAVKYIDGSVCIVAGPGTGKTRALTSKIAFLIKEKNIDENKILAVSFTNKAANEMKERVADLLGKDCNVLISTFHKLASIILREDSESINLSRNYQIIDTNDQKIIAKQLTSELNFEKGTFKKINFSKEFSKINKNIYSYNSNVNSIENQIFKIYEKYCEYKRKNNLVDFDDLLILVNELFDKNKEIANKWANKFDYILVDEFQDINSYQYKLILKLASNNKNITIVGDPDQTIYKFQGAKIKYILDFQKDFENSKIITLKQNYRSTKKNIGYIKWFNIF